MNTATKAHVGAGRPAKGPGDLILAGVDDGYAMTKVALPDGTLLKIPSRARAGASGVSSFGATGASFGVHGGYQTAEGRFAVAEYLEGEGTRFDAYPFSPLNRVVVHHALRLAGLGGKRLKVATGLPVAHFFLADSSRNMRAINQKRASLAVPVSADDGTPTAEIAVNQVYAQGVAAWVDHALATNGQVLVNLGAPAAVVDIGGRTTDCVLVLPDHRIDHARSGTENLGVLTLYDVVKARIQRQFGSTNIQMLTVEDAVRTGTMLFFGERKDVREIVDAAKLEVAGQIVREVQRRIGSGQEVERIVFVGGGAVVFNNLTKSFPNAVTSKDPEFANARGLLKFMMHVEA